MVAVVDITGLRFYLRLSMVAARLTLFMVPLLVFALGVGCADRFSSQDTALKAIEKEITRVFESKSIAIAPRVDPVSDGHSTFYRAYLVDANGAFVDGGIISSHIAGNVEGVRAPGPDIDLDIYWTIAGERVGEGYEVVAGFSRGDRYMIEVSASFHGSVVYTSNIPVLATSIGSFSPGETTFLTLHAIGGHFATPGRIVAVEGGNGLESLTVSGLTADVTIARAEAAGYLLVKSVAGDTRYSTNVFVSPVPTVHVDRSDRDWYFTQFQTNTTSNCGPTIASMGIAWAIGIDVPVSTVRSIVGWTGGGGVTMPEIKEVLDGYSVKSSLHWLTSPDEIFEMLERGNLVGVVYDMAGVSFTPNPKESFFGQYYVDYGGHYLMIKGYSADHQYFVVYDPIPSDWAENAGRYDDGVSMYGRNRYYAVDELFASLRSLQVVEISR